MLDYFHVNYLFVLFGPGEGGHELIHVEDGLDEFFYREQLFGLSIDVLDDLGSQRKTRQFELVVVLRLDAVAKGWNLGWLLSLLFFLFFCRFF